MNVVPVAAEGSGINEHARAFGAHLVQSALVPDYALGAHSGSLGPNFNTGALTPSSYRNGAFIRQHGWWNREPPSGYKVLFVPFTDGEPSGDPQDILTGFLNAEGKAMGRPKGVVIDVVGALLVADDVGNKV